MQPTRSSNERPVARVPASGTNCLGMVSVCPMRIPIASTPAREPAPTSARNGGGVRRGDAPTESRGRKTPGMLRSPVCTSAGCASKSERKNPPRCLSSSVPSSRMAVITKPISSRWATNTTSGSPSPTLTIRLPAVSVVALRPRRAACGSPRRAPGLPCRTRHRSRSSGASTERTSSSDGCCCAGGTPAAGTAATASTSRAPHGAPAIQRPMSRPQ